MVRLHPGELTKAGDPMVRGDIQGLRAIAVGLVVLAHLATYQAGPSWLEGGFIGVDVFFVLSGYLITSLLMREVDRDGRVSLVGFYARRARRILPAATVTLAVVVAYAAVRLPRSQYTRIVPDAWWSALFGANWHFAHDGTSYFEPSFLSPLQHFWSLAVEEQFYLAWPLLVLVLAPRVPRRALAAVVAVVIAGSLAWSIHLTGADAQAAYFSTPARVHELAIGTLLAVVTPPALGRTARGALGLAGLAALGVATLWLGSGSAFPGWRALVPTLATAALIIAGHGDSTGTPAVTRLLALAPLRWVGDISYSLYLWHFPVIVLAASYLPDAWDMRVRIPVELVVMLLLAAASYRLVEQPFRHRAGPLRGLLASSRRTLVLWPVALAVILAVTLASGRWSTHRQHDRLEASGAWWAAHPVAAAQAPATPAQVEAELRQALALDEQGAPVPPSIGTADESRNYWGASYDCFADYGESTAPGCAYGDAAADTVVAVVGDSHAGMWVPALDALGEREHVRIVPLVKVGCAPYAVRHFGRRMTQAECDAFRSWTLTRLAQLRPDVILTAARGELFMRPQDGTGVDEQWRAGVRASLRAFAAITPSVVVLGDVPSRPDPDACLTDPSAVLRDCHSDDRSTETHSNAITAAVAADLGLAWAPTDDLACTGGVCPLVASDLRVYHDTSHLSLTWVRHVSGALGQLVGADSWARPGTAGG